MMLLEEKNNQSFTIHYEGNVTIHLVGVETYHWLRVNLLGHHIHCLGTRVCKNWQFIQWLLKYLNLDLSGLLTDTDILELCC